MKYLISFPSAAMVATGAELDAAGRDSHAVIEQAKAAGVYVFGGGIDEREPPLRVSADGAVAEGGYPWAPPLTGGFTVMELPSREEAIAWAERNAIPFEVFEPHDSSPKRISYSDNFRTDRLVPWTH